MAYFETGNSEVRLNIIIASRSRASVPILVTKKVVHGPIASSAEVVAAIRNRLSGMTATL